MAVILRYALLILAWSSWNYCRADHLRSAEITSSVLSCHGYSYLIEFTLYVDLNVITENDLQIHFGDGSAVQTVKRQDFQVKEQVSYDIEKWQYQVNYVFPGPGTYHISLREAYRNEKALNLQTEGPVPFYVESQIIIDPYIGCNNSPFFLLPPVDQAAVNQPFTHLVAAIDPDGDSLSYHLVPPQRAKDSSVPEYIWPNSETICRKNAGGRVSGFV